MRTTPAPPPSNYIGENSKGYAWFLLALFVAAVVGIVTIDGGKPPADAWTGDDGILSLSGDHDQDAVEWSYHARDLQDAVDAADWSDAGDKAVQSRLRRRASLWNEARKKGGFTEAAEVAIPTREE